jgi:hypothetical protein
MGSRRGIRRARGPTLRRVIASAAVSMLVVLLLAVRVLGPSQTALASPDGPCLTQGLKPIPVRLRLFVTRRSGLEIPYLKVAWSGRPLPRACDAHVYVSSDTRVWFSKLGGPTELGVSPIGRWRVFWEGKRVVHHAHEIYRGPVFTFPLGCVVKSRAWLKYEVVRDDGVTEAQRIRPVSVQGLACP